MVKGINRQAIVVRAPDTALFEQAIFLLREDALKKNGVGEKELLEEARRIADSYLQKNLLRPRRQIPPLGYMLIGALPFFAAWLLTLML